MEASVNGTVTAPEGEVTTGTEPKKTETDSHAKRAIPVEKWKEFGTNIIRTGKRSP
ncbi:MAG: hypothetical protein GY940_07985 [bacterium]|nr:hypothetical protein [bacterium]